MDAIGCANFIQD